MTILVDYSCTSCGLRAEHWTASPPPTAVDCPGCGQQSRRVWVPIGLGGANATSAGDPVERRATSPSGPSLASRYPHLPGLCHLSEDAGRMWVAKYRRDNRAVERELARQEQQARDRAPTIEDAQAHRHITGS